MTSYTFTITKRQTKTKGVAFDLFVKIDRTRYRPTLGYDLTDQEAHQRAIAMIATIQRSLKAPRVPLVVNPNAATTLADVLPIYWHTMKLHRRVETDRPRSILDTHLLPFFKDQYLAALTAQDGLDYVQSRKRQGAKDGTILREYGVLLRLLNLAVDYDLLDKNRLKVVHIPKPESRKRVATMAELTTLEKTVSPELWRMCVVALHTGLRQAKILAIDERWLRLEEDGWWLVLPKARSKIKSNASKIPLNASAIGALLPAGQPLSTGRIFSRWNTRDSFKTAWFREVGQTSIQGLTFHDLKHTCLTRLQNCHVIYEVRQWLGGHTMKGETATYSHGGHGWDALLREAVTKLEEAYGVAEKKVVVTKEGESRGDA